MFVELEKGELLNLDCVVRIFIEKQNSESYKVTAEYVSGGTIHFGVIHRGTVSQCNLILSTLRNSLDIVEIFP